MAKKDGLSGLGGLGGRAGLGGLGGLGGLSRRGFLRGSAAGVAAGAVSGVSGGRRALAADKVVKIGREIQYSATAREESSLRIANSVDDVAKQLKTFMGEKGYDFSGLLETGLRESATIGQLRQQTAGVHHATEVVQGLIQRELVGEFSPFVVVTFE